MGNIEVIRQHLSIDGIACERLFCIDTIEPQLSFSPSTECSAETEAWFERETPTLTRYTEVIS